MKAPAPIEPLLLDPFLDGLLSPFIAPLVKFWVDQKIDPLLFGYAIGAEALLNLLFYEILERRQRRLRLRLGRPDFILSVPYALVLAATVLAYGPIPLYILSGVNAYFILAIFTGSFYFFCVRNHLAYLKRRLFSPEERELFDRRADKTYHFSSATALILLALFFLDPADFNPAAALALCFLLSDIGLLFSFAYYRLRLGRP